MQPEIHFLGLTLQTFGIMFALSFVAAGLVVARRLKELDKPVDWAYEMIFAALLGGIVGAKLWWAIDNDQMTLSGLFSGSGLTWYGGAIGGALAVTAWASRHGMRNLALLDMCAPALAVGYAVGRVGCQLSGDGDYGKASDLPWAMAYPDGVVPTDQQVHPTPVYETLSMGLVAWVLWRMRDRVRPGALFAWYLVFAGAERFLVEFVRRNEPAVLGLTTAQLVSLAMLVAGAGWLIALARRGGITVARRAPRAATA
jgi:phosphatidylglycerol:prolipoprotein diacylglycerol transferase